MNLAEYEKIKGNEFMKTKDFDQAIECYSRSIDLNPSLAATFSNRALAYLNVRNNDAAIEDSNAALKLQNDFLRAYSRRGKAYLAKKEFELAIADF